MYDGRFVAGGHPGTAVEHGSSYPECPEILRNCMRPRAHAI